MFSIEVLSVLSVLATIAATIFLYIKVLPRKLDGTFPKKFLQMLHDYFHFKKLYIEEVLKFIFVLATVACVCAGVFLLLGYTESYHYSYYSGGYTTRESTFLYGLAVLIGGPIALRLTYEGLMMFILAVKNIMDINNKLPSKKASTEAPKAEVQEEAPVEE